MNQTLLDTRILAELYDVHPQAIVWSKMIRSEDGTTIIDLEYTYCNEEGLRYLNLTREQQQAGLRLSNSPTLTPALRVQLLEEMIRVYQTGEKAETSLYNPALNKFARVIRTRLRDGVLSIIQDRTEENRTIQQVEAQKLLLDNILTHSSNGITVGEMIRDSSGGIIDIRTLVANDAASKFTGIPKDLYLSKTGGELNPGFIGSAYFQQCVRCMQTGEPFITQYHFENINRWLEVSVSKMDEERQIYIFTDVTPIKEAQLTLERSADRLHTVINTSPAGFFMGTPVLDDKGGLVDFRFTLVNKVLASFVGEEPEKLIGRLGSERFVKYKINGLFERFREVYLTGIPQQFDFQYKGETVEVWANLTITRQGDELMGMFTDLTPLKKLQLQLETMVAELRQSNASLEEFAYAASHDLQEPLRKIYTFTDRLKTALLPQLNEGQKAMFDRVENATMRMRRLIDDLLAYSQVSRQAVAFTQVDINRVFEVVLQDLEVRIHETGAIVSVDSLPVITGDERQLRQLFQNLLGNAIKYRKPDAAPQVTITCCLVLGEEIENVVLSNTGDKFYQIQVQDNGIGFEQEYAEGIFEVFHRLHGRAEYEGTGIGLAIAQRVVQNHNGYIKAEGKPGEGATFRVLLPL